MPAPIFRARRDAKLRARVMSERELVYDADSLAIDRPKHVRAGSGMAWSGEKMVVIQDAADYLAIIDVNATSGGVSGMRLKAPAGVRRGALHLEAVLSAKDWRGDFLLAFGSGESPEKRNVARMRLSGGDTDLSVFETRKLYAALKELPELTTTINIEGAAFLPKGVEGRDGARLFHRANGKPRADGPHLSATVDIRLDAFGAYLDRCKRDPNATLGTDPINLRRYDLDEIEDVPLSFTDAAGLPDGRVVYIAAAERPTTNECLGMAFGVIDPDGSARYTLIVERDGAPTRRLAEGMAIRDDKRAFMVMDPADPERPSTMCTVDLSGV